jgi:hypothetical protein
MTGACTITEADSGVILECVRCRLQQASGPEIEMAIQGRKCTTIQLQTSHQSQPTDEGQGLHEDLNTSLSLHSLPSNKARPT